MNENGAMTAQVEAPKPSELELLTEIRDMTKKELIWQRISSSAMVIICVTLFIICINLIPKVVGVIENINEVADVAVNSMHEIDLMISDVRSTNENVNKVIEDNAVPLSEAVDSMSKVDYEGLNQAITDLQDTVGPMATFFKRFQ